MFRTFDPIRLLVSTFSPSGLPLTLLILTCIGLLVGGCAKSPTGPDRPRGSAGSVDVNPVWSRDGRYIAFLRRSPSSAGPPGVYIVPSAGGPIRFVAPGDFFFPTHMRFSPDGKQIVCMIALQLYILDIATGTVTRLEIPEGIAIYPDWSPDGRYIVYASAGIRLLDLVTGDSNLIPGDPASGMVGYGGDIPLWSPDGTQIALIQSFPREYRVVLFDRDGTHYRILAGTGSDRVLYDILHWYVRPTRGMEGLAFRQLTGPGAGVYYVNRDGSSMRRFERHFHMHEAFSPDGEWMVRTGIDPVDSIAVLFVERIDDVTGATRRQLTYWDPPSATPPAVGVSRPSGESRRAAAMGSLVSIGLSTQSRHRRSWRARAGSPSPRRAGNDWLIEAMATGAGVHRTSLDGRWVWLR